MLFTIMKLSVGNLFSNKTHFLGQYVIFLWVTDELQVDIFTSGKGKAVDLHVRKDFYPNRIKIEMTKEYSGTSGRMRQLFNTNWSEHSYRPVFVFRTF